MLQEFTYVLQENTCHT